MPSFLSKVFGRKKDEKDAPRAEGRVSDASLLEGNFEALSPSTTKFPEAPNGKGQTREKDGFMLFRVKSRQPPPETSEKRVAVPQLSLRLPSQREAFESESDDQKSLTDSVIGDRRLNPAETLTLIRACSQAITARGLETLGVMHPHWYSASPDIQRHLISLFIQSLAPKSPISTLAPTASPFVSAFESEISSARSPHDVAAVLRWGIRHLRLEGNSFGKDDTWYKTFFDAEHSSGYPPPAFSTQLAPQLPGPHLELLVATLEILSLLAAHAEANGISGSKLSKFFGLWLLTVKRAEDRDDWSTFYARWERMGRILEHLFLSRIRDEAASSRMPTRLLELVHQYPYTRTSTSSLETDLLPRPRFSTRQYDALFVRIETEISASSKEPRPHPLRLLSEAFNAETSSSDNSDHAELWGSIKKAVANQTNPSPGGYPALSHIFADETIRFLSLLPIEDSDKEPLLPPFNLLISKKPAANGRRSVSDPIPSPSATSPSISQHTRLVTEPAPSTLPSAITPSLSVRSTDWAEFSSSGFSEANKAVAPLAATLIGTDKGVGLAAPSTSSATMTTRRSRLRPVTPISINVNGRKSLDGHRSIIKEEGTQSEKPISRATLLSLVQLDEAFIDFWADALPDPIAADWPAFVICKLNEGVNGLDLTVDGGKRINWLVIEQAFKRPVVPSVEVNGATADVGGSRRPRPASPKASMRSETTLHSMKKRFSFWSASGRASVDGGIGTGKGKGKTGVPKVGEMGEMLREEDEKEAAARSGMASLNAKSSTSAEVKRKSVMVTEKPVDVPKANGNGVVGLGISGLAAGVALASAATAVEAVSAATDSKPLNTSAAAAPLAPITVIAPAPPKTHKAEFAPARRRVEEAVPGPAVTVVSNKQEKPAVNHIPEPVHAVVAQIASLAEVAPDVTTAPAAEPEPASPAVQADETETDVTIDVETVEPVPFSDTSSVASPVPSYVQPAVVVTAPEPVEVLAHAELLRVHERDGVEPTAETELIPFVEGPTVVPAAVEESHRVHEETQKELSPTPERVMPSSETHGPTVALSASEQVTITHVAAAEDEVELDEDATQPAHLKSNGSATWTDSPSASEPAPMVESLSPPLAAEPVVQPETSPSDDFTSAPARTTPPISN